MNLRFNVVIIGLFLGLVLAFAGGSMAQTQQGYGAKDQASNPSMSLVPASQKNLPASIVFLHLEVYDKAMNEPPPSCGENCPDFVSSQTSWVDVWSCIAKSCAAGGDNKSIDCFKYFMEPLPDLSKKELGDKLLCDMARNPSIESRQVLIKAFSPPNSKGDGFAEGMAYFYAFKGDATSCQNEVKNFVGPYGPAWNARWFEVMSGCDILARKRTRAQEESDYVSWLGGNCADIVDPEMRKACNTPGMAFPDARVPSGK